MRILVFSAHSADYCARAGGTIVKHIRAGAEVRVVALSYGERSESAGLYANGAKPSLEEVKAIRHADASRAAEVLGAEIRFLDWGDYSFDFSQNRAKLLAEEIRSYRPSAILTQHGPDPISPDHEVTWRLVQRAAIMAQAHGLESDYPRAEPAPIFLFEATNPLVELEGFCPDFYVDITDVWEVKLKAVQEYAVAQAFLIPRYTDVAKRRALQARFLTGCDDVLYAEAFARTTPWVGDCLPLNLT